MPASEKPQVIGAKTLVDFPDQQLSAVPAKVDTGADSSAIWATSIEEKDGVIKFVLFDVGAPWYNGKTISASNYSVRSIKNSFGDSEYRYKISLPVVLNGRKFNARFTLSDRRNNRYPILIGRQTLKNRFVVDVSRNVQAAPDVKKRILVLVHKGNQAIAAYYSDIQNKSDGRLAFDVRRYEDLIFYADENAASARFAQDGRDIRDYAFVYFKTRVKNAEKAAMVAEIASREGIAFADTAAALLATDTKAHQAMLLAGHGITQPKMIMMSHPHWQPRFDEVTTKLGLPFVFKDNAGLKGRNNFLIKSHAEYKKAIKITQELQMIAQQFIPNEGYYRLIIFGKKLAFAMYRPIDQASSHLYKRSRDGAPALVSETQLPSEAIKMCLSAAELLKIEVAGVDMVADKEKGLWYCLEVNNSPQLAGGAFVDEKLTATSKYFIEEIDR